MCLRLKAVLNTMFIDCNMKPAEGKKSPLNMQIPEWSLKALDFLFTFEHSDAGLQTERVGSCQN